ncbi:hypothetical protein [Bowmanella sp. JS7-9]|uniref:Uncharacterized protein n=1 Tax=Pseudobowmanella zhangzhouensis TaxID=1537679 RepID=A0ABW1XQJ4_9ALTE|nr:hypothetical protein [Bowmanella sp. JS7-9]TBX21947.1 hypothetical protein TK45_10705 [Bowmanella sp. JS7-9]
MSILDQVVVNAQVKNVAVNRDHPEMLYGSIDYLSDSILSLSQQIATLNDMKSQLQRELLVALEASGAGSLDANSSSVKADTGKYKVTVRQNATRKILDAAELSRVAPEVVKNEPKLDARKLNGLAINAPERYQQALRYIETSYSKPSYLIEKQ